MLPKWHAVVVVDTPVAVPPNEGRPLLFDLSLDPDVHTLSQAQHAEKIRHRTGEDLLGLGDDVTFEARHLGIRWRMTARITELDRPGSFVDEQVSGPFDAFRHEHVFEPAGDSTVVRDVFSFRLPGAWLGGALARYVAAPYLRRILTARSAHLRELPSPERQIAGSLRRRGRATWPSRARLARGPDEYRSTRARRLRRFQLSRRRAAVGAAPDLTGESRHGGNGHESRSCTYGDRTPSIARDDVAEDRVAHRRVRIRPGEREQE